MIVTPTLIDWELFQTFLKENGGSPVLFAPWGENKFKVTPLIDEKDKSKIPMIYLNGEPLENQSKIVTAGSSILLLKLNEGYTIVREGKDWGFVFHMFEGEKYQWPA